MSRKSKTAAEEKEKKMKTYKCKQCGEELLETDFGSFSELEEALWAHIQLEHRKLFKTVQNLDTPSMIYSCYVEKPDKLSFEPDLPLADSVQEANRTAAIDIFGIEMSDFEVLNYQEMKLTRHVCFHPARMGDIDLSAVEDLPLHELEQLREEQADRIKASLAAANAAMDALILERTKLCVYDALITRAQIEPLEQTHNLWELSNQSFLDQEKAEISNAVYKFSYSHTEEENYSYRRSQNERAWYLTWDMVVRSANGINSPVKLGGVDRRRFTDKNEMIAYLARRQKQFEHLFKEDFPPVPAKYAENFSYGGKLLPGYRLEGESA